MPKRPRRSPLSRRIGSTVPRAVLVRAVPMTSASYAAPPLSRKASPMPAAMGTSQAHSERRRGPAAHGRELDLVPGEEDQHGQAQVGQCVDDLVGVRPPEDVRADDDAQRDLEDDQRNANSARRASREQRGEHGDGHDQYERAEMGHGRLAMARAAARGRRNRCRVERRPDPGAPSGAPLCSLSPRSPFLATLAAVPDAACHPSPVRAPARAGVRCPWDVCRARSSVGSASLARGGCGC